MKKTVLHHILALLVPWLLISAACSPLPSGASGPDQGYRYDDLPSGGHEDLAISEYRAIAKWDKFDLTYAFANGTNDLPGDTEREVIHQAFDLWAAQAPLSFTEIDRPDQADILISWARGAQAEGEGFDGPGGVLAQASFPNPYEERQVFLQFDDDEGWVNSQTGDVDLLTVAAHEIGHTLGLAHSSDLDSIMYPSYSAPHRFLGQDDVAGVQALYGMASAPQPQPQAPPANASPPPSQGEDADGDGIADSDESLGTGTDPNNPDTDGDGLGDGVEVVNHMNPLDPDMDKDGVSDGQEVSQGTDPFFPDQGVDVSPELEKEVSDFLTQAIELEIRAYREGDASVAAGVMAGETYAQLESGIDSLNRQGLVQIAEIDYYQSYIDAIRVINAARLEVNTCEVWTTATYRASDGTLLNNDGPTLLPQTITIQKLDQGWFITSVEFFDAPAFCK
jgi:hypothetical protein